ncbi:DUF2796 domain-containing protein [Halopseudomonas pelagia]|uniref:DUF2796 domain-containing protein n=1 Tax=Halopseudomonas pelagia TaxID=553151 RepID=UPI0003A0FE43|nr:DUF2796 domain-containing protein [Halopseudomonas pelagia]|tara:strand:+ start:132 stop:764 length:633 start_codon:yes stop_codon:yes gene_type:complete
MRPTPFIIGSLLAAMSFASAAHDHADHGHDEHKHEDKHDHDHDHGHDSLSAHEHGVGSLNLVVDGNDVSIELDSPADNLLGFEYLPTSDADKAKVKALRTQLNEAEALFVFPAAADCSLKEVELNSPLFDAVADEHGHDHDHGEKEKAAEAHADIQAHFHFTCTQAAKLDQIQVALFSAFPGTERLLLQAIGPKGQQGGELTAAQNLIRF